VTPPDTVAAHAAVQRRILAVLAVTQVLAGVGMATALAVSTLVAARLSGSDLVGGAALTCVVLGAAGAALVVARVATRHGRRPALGLGYAVGTVGAAGTATAVGAGKAPMMLVGLLLVGAATAAGLAARFAATDLAAPERRARALGLVVWSTTVGAVAGPNLAGPLQTLAGKLGLVPAAGPFWLCALAFGLAAAGTWWGLRPDPLLLARGTAVSPTASGSGGTAARAALLASPAALLGAGGVVVGHLVMIALMSMTPVHLDHGGATLTVVGLVISAHVAGMYAFSPVFGWLADRLGRPRVLALAAGLLLAAAVVCAAAGPDQAGLVGVGLVLLGLGWSASLVAGSALVTESVPLAVRPAAQGLVDVAMNVSGALGGVAGGLVVAGASFGVLGVTAAVVVAPYLVAAGGFALRARPAVG
jgi:MFS family permease